MTTILNNLKTIKQAPPDNHKSGSKRFEQTLKRIEWIGIIISVKLEIVSI